MVIQGYQGYSGLLRVIRVIIRMNINIHERGYQGYHKNEYHVSNIHKSCRFKWLSEGHRRVNSEGHQRVYQSVNSEC